MMSELPGLAMKMSLRLVPLISRVRDGKRLNKIAVANDVEFGGKEACVVRGFGVEAVGQGGTQKILRVGVVQPDD
jgi:hypothetical protein